MKEYKFSGKTIVLMCVKNIPYTSNNLVVYFLFFNFHNKIFPGTRLLSVRVSDCSGSKHLVFTICDFSSSWQYIRHHSNSNSVNSKESSSVSMSYKDY